MTIRANRYDLERLCWSLAALDGHLSPVIPQRDTVTLAGAAGVDGSVTRVGPRTVVVDCEVRPDTLAERQTIIRRIWRRLDGMQELESADLPGVVIRARLTDVQVMLYTGAFALPAASIQLTFTATDPARVDVEPLVYGLSTARVPLPVGTATSALEWWIYGSCTNPSLILRSATGAEVARLTWTVVLGSNDALYGDGASGAMVRTVAGVVQTGSAAGLAVLTSGRVPVLSPEDGTPDETAFPTLELAATSGTPTGLVRYSRRWA